jgi:hypothetical protein
MKIVINKTKRLLFVGKTMISTGTNVMADDFDADNANVKAWVKAKMVSVKDTDKMSEDELVEAIETAYDNAVVDALKKVSKSKKVLDEAKEQKAENDKKDSELDAAIEEAKKAAGKKKD